MKPYDFCFGMNWVEQFRSALSLQGESPDISHYPDRYDLIERSLIWSATREGRVVWKERDYALRFRTRLPVRNGNLVR